MHTNVESKIKPDVTLLKYWKLFPIQIHIPDEQSLNAYFRSYTKIKIHQIKIESRY